MNRSPTTATTRAICLLAITTLWSGLAASEAMAGQAAATAATVPEAAPRTVPEVTPKTVPSEALLAVRQSGGVPQSTDADGWSYGARGIVSLLRQESLNTGIGASGFAVLPLTTDLELEGEFGFATMSTDTNGLPAGRLTVFPLRGTLRVQLWRFGGAKPYAGGGIGVYMNRFSLDAAVEQGLAQVGFAASASVDPALGIHAAGGIEWERDQLRFGIDVKYVLGDADTVSTLVDQVTQQVIRETSSIDLNGLWIAGGVRFNF